MKAEFERKVGATAAGARDDGAVGRERAGGGGGGRGEPIETRSHLGGNGSAPEGRAEHLR